MYNYCWSGNVGTINSSVIEPALNGFANGKSFTVIVSAEIFAALI